MQRRFEYSVSVPGEAPLARDRELSPEDLVLAGLVRCTLASLAFFAERQGVRATGSGGADGLVAKREDDGRYAFVEVECGLDVELAPLPAGDALRKLLESAEWGCFVGASLTVTPRYEWRVNGHVISM